MHAGSIRRNVFLAIVTASVFVTILFGAVLYPFESSRLQTRIREARNLLNALYLQKRGDLANEIFLRKRLALESSIKEFYKFSDVIGVSLYDREGTLLLCSHGPCSEKLQEASLFEGDSTPLVQEGEWLDTPVITFTGRIDTLGEHLGYLRMHYSLERIRKETRLSYMLAGSLLGLVLLVMSFLLNFMLSRSVIAPIHRLRNAIAKLRAGHLGEKVELSGADEISQVGERFNDLSEALRVSEEARSTYAAELEDKAEELGLANARLRELDSMKSAFLSSVSHELRTPLTSVRGFTHIIRKDFHHILVPEHWKEPRNCIPCDRIPRINENLCIIARESERLTDMINDVLDLSRIEEGRMEWNDAFLDMKGVLLRAAESVQGLLENKPGVELVVDADEELPKVFADAERIHQVLINLMGNAVKFTERGDIVVRAVRQGWLNGGLLLSVRDHGPGIPENDLERIFDQFYQATQGDMLAEKPKGTGLGLAICRQIVTHYRGRIWAETAQGGGAVLYIFLPESKE